MLLPLPRAPVGHQLCCVPHGMNSSVVLLVVPCLSFSAGGKASGSVNQASTKWSGITQMRSFGLLLLQPPFGHSRHAAASDLQTGVPHHTGQQTAVSYN